MARCEARPTGCDLLVYEQPDPVKAYKLSISHGIDAVYGRWPRLTKGAVSKIVSQGKQLVTGAPPRSRRSPVEIDRVCEAVLRLDSFEAVARELGISPRSVRRAWDTARVTARRTDVKTPPIVERAARARAAQESSSCSK